MSATMTMRSAVNDEQRVTMRTAMILAVLLHTIFFISIPQKTTEISFPSVTVPQLIEILEDVIVPEAPKEIRRPQLPLPTFEADVIQMSAEPTLTDETILDHEVSVSNPMNRLTPTLPSTGEAVFKSWDKEPEPRRLYKPVYPDLARAAGIEGTVIARAEIDRHGNVVRVQILESDAEIFNDAVRTALRRSTFYPAEQRDIQIKSWVIVPYEFSLRD